MMKASPRVTAGQQSGLAQKAQELQERCWENRFKERIYRFPDMFEKVRIHIQQNFTILLEAL